MILSVTNAIYAIPSIALFVLLAPALGITNDKPIIVAMALYTLVILVRNIVEAIRAVPPTVVAGGRRHGLPPARPLRCASSCRSPCPASSPGCDWRR